MMTDEAIGALDLFLDNAVLGINEVRIIHGKGTGAVRKAVRAPQAQPLRQVLPPRPLRRRRGWCDHRRASVSSPVPREARGGLREVDSPRRGFGRSDRLSAESLRREDGVTSARLRQAECLPSADIRAQRKE